MLMSRQIGLVSGLITGSLVLPHFFPTEIVAAILVANGLGFAIYWVGADIVQAIREEQP